MKIDVQNLCLSIDGKNILDDICISFPDNSFTAIIGPNGAGKTSLLKCLNCIQEDWHGTISLGARDIRQFKKSEIAAAIAYVPQRLETAISYTVEDFMDVSLYGSIKSPSERRSAIDYALSRIGMNDFRKRFMQTMSGGEVQKVLIAAALALAPQILLLDEPTAFLDPRIKHEIQELFKAIKAENNMTIVSVFHDLNLAYACADRVIGMQDGHVLFAGNVQETLTPDNARLLFNTQFQELTIPETGEKILL